MHHPHITMADPYNIYGAVADRGCVSSFNFPGYLSTETSQFASHHIPGSTELQGASSDFLRREVNPLQPVPYGLDDIPSIGVRPEPAIHPQPVIGRVMAEAGGKAYTSPLEDPNILSKRGDGSACITSAIPDMINDRPSSLRSADGPLVPQGESNILFVDGLPTDCTRREVGHLFRPFIGYKEIKVVHKEPRHSGDRATVLCFVEFVDAKCALTAMEALQGYKFDDKRPDSAALRIQFAHFPFRPPSEHDGQRIGIPHKSQVH